LDQTDFIPKVKAAQSNGSGAAMGRASLPNCWRQDALEVFTTRPDTPVGGDLHGGRAGTSTGGELLDPPGVADYVRKSGQKNREMERSELKP
jgi:hypothetical protein